MHSQEVQESDPAIDHAMKSEWTVDGLAALTGFTVRNIRYYVTLGLLPPTTRRGRMAYFSEAHRSRLELIRTMQEVGWSLGAIEQHLEHIPADTPPADIELRQSMFTSWASPPPVSVSRKELDIRAGRKLSKKDVLTLQRLGTLREIDDGFEVRPTFEVGVELLKVDIPVESMEAAGAAISHHMNELVRELSEIMQNQVLEPMRERQSVSDPHLFKRTMTRLRHLTFDAVVANFQQAISGLFEGPQQG